MPRSLIAAAVGALLLGCSASAGTSEVGNLTQAPPTLLENRFLAAELELAGKPQFYLVFDLADRRVLLKARGRTFRSWDIRSLAYWGTGVPLEPLSLTGKSTLFAPQRITLTPPPPPDQTAAAAPEEEVPIPDTFEIEALELGDMPAAYSLSLEGGVSIAVSPRSSGFWAGLKQLLHVAWWNISLPPRALWHRLHGQPFAALEVVLGAEDSQALYWAFPEKSRALIHQ